MAQLVTANPKLFSKSPDQELSESVIKVSGNSKFTRLDVREQWTSIPNKIVIILISQLENNLRISWGINWGPTL